MPDTPKYLAQDKRISLIMFQILNVAKAGGMPSEQAEAMYDSILTRYMTLDIEAAEDLISDIGKIIAGANDV